MKLPTQVDAIVVGGGIVGGAAALALHGCGLDTMILERTAPAVWRPEQPDIRVYAFAPDNIAFLRTLGVWESIVAARAQPYYHMHVWDAARPIQDALHFDATALGSPELGWIIENDAMVDRLWQRVRYVGIPAHYPVEIQSVAQNADHVMVQLQGGQRLKARLLVAADGKSSTIRALAGISSTSSPYAHQAVMAYVRTEMPHQCTAWQRFLPTGPFAVLPCADGLSAIVWTVPDAMADYLLARDEKQFNILQTNAFAAALGKMDVCSERKAFRLVRQLASTYAQGRIVLAGDAAHVVHPLAGQGVNLGLRDISALQTMVMRAQKRALDWSSISQLERWGRRRHSEDTCAAYGFDAIHRIYSNSSVLPVLLRGRLLKAVGKCPPLVHGLWRNAIGNTPGVRNVLGYPSMGSGRR